jgi:hypothetical protein
MRRWNRSSALYFTPLPHGHGALRPGPPAARRGVAELSAGAAASMACISRHNRRELGILRGAVEDGGSAASGTAVRTAHPQRGEVVLDAEARRVIPCGDAVVATGRAMRLNRGQA